MHTDDYLALLRLMQLADSALPVGAAAHSFGLETLVAEEYLEVTQLGPFLRDYLEEAGVVEGAFCRLGYRLASHTDRALFTAEWLALNEQLSAIKTARESRAASAALGRRFLQLLLSLEDAPLIQIAMQSARSSGKDTHYSIAFGLAGGVVKIDETAMTLAYFQQSLIGLVSASQLIWQLKPTLLTVADRSKEVAANCDVMSLCTPLVEVGSMRHPYLATRLFIS
jgi:urease accessory protein